MEIFLSLLLKIAPLYFIIFLGYLAGRYLHVQKASIANLLIYFIVPIVVFEGIINIKISLSTLAIPVLFFLMACVISICAFYLSGIFWKDATRNILALMGGSSNIGYFGLPVAIAIFGKEALGIVALSIIGGSLYNNTFGFYFAAKGNHTTRESIIKVLKLPMIYTFFLGIIVNISGMQMDPIISTFLKNFDSAFTILGMMLVGIGLGDTEKFQFDFKFTAFSLVITYVLWPILMLTLILLDLHIFHIYPQHLYKMFILLSILPVAANMVAYSTILKIHPQKTAVAVSINTLFALFYIPLIVSYFLQ